MVETATPGKPVDVPGHPDFVPNINLDNNLSTGSGKGDGGKDDSGSLKRYQRSLKRKLAVVHGKKTKRQPASILTEIGNTPTLPPISAEEEPVSDCDVDYSGTDTSEEQGQLDSCESSEMKDCEGSAIDDVTKDQLYQEIDFLRNERDQAIKQCSALQEELNNAKPLSGTVEGVDRKCKIYTGLPWDIFMTTFNLLLDTANNKGVPKILYRDHFFLILVKLKHGPKFKYLANQTGLNHPSTMIDYFWKWIDILTSTLDFQIAWPDHERICQIIPPHFKVMYRRLTAIIDCSEFYNETPGPVKAHAQCYSQYKKHTTVNILIACNPLGAVTYLSPVYGGRISDVNLVRDCGFMSANLHHPGDQILADRGFTMGDEFASCHGVELISPSFLKGRNQLPSEEVHNCRKLSSVRIHIERVIGLLKNRFAILQGVLPIRFIKSMKDEVEEVQR